MTLDEATKEFEATFGEVIEGNAGPLAQNGQPYIEVCSQGKMQKACGFDTEEQAIESWREALKPFRGRKFLFWRVRPETGQDENKMDFLFPEHPNPNYGKWGVYSRFLATDITA